MHQLSCHNSELIQVNWTVENQGDGDADVYPVPAVCRLEGRIILSNDDQWNESDIKITDTVRLGDIVITEQLILKCNGSHPKCSRAGNYYFLLELIG